MPDVAKPTWIAAVLGPDLPHGSAACAGRSPLFDLDVAGENHNERADRLELATSVCEGCEIRFECSIAVKAEDQPQGIWAGLPHGQRDALKLQRQSRRS